MLDLTVMDTFVFVKSENDGVGGKPKGEKIGKGSTVGSIARKRLTDISNLQRTKPSNQVDKPQSNSVSAKDYIDQLQKENAMLLKLLSDRNKIIESSGIELQKLQINLQRAQQQNLQLAQANSNMLAELNTGKDKLKALHHELGCRNGLIAALKFDSQVVATLKCKGKAESLQAEKDGNQDKAKENTTNRRQSARFIKSDEDPEPNENLFEVDKAKENTTNRRKRQSARFIKSDEDPEPNENLFEVDKAKEKTETKRRRQSARFVKSEDPKRSEEEDLFEIDNNTILPVCTVKEDDYVHESDPSSSHGFEVKEEEENGDCGPGSFVSRRSSSGRPQRRAAEKGLSYKELPVNVKMRRDF